MYTTLTHLSTLLDTPNWLNVNSDIISSYLHLGLPNGLSLCFPTKTLNAILGSFICASCPAYQILCDLTALPHDFVPIMIISLWTKYFLKHSVLKHPKHTLTLTCERWRHICTAQSVG